MPIQRHLINFRGTKDFALVPNKRGGTKPPASSGIVWASCRPDQNGRGTIQAVRLITFRSINNSNTGGLTLGGFSLGIGGAIVGGLPGAIVGTLLGAGIGSLDSNLHTIGQWTPTKPQGPKFTPIKGPCTASSHLRFNPDSNYHEATFDEFTQQQADIRTAEELGGNQSNNTRVTQVMR